MAVLGVDGGKGHWVGALRTRQQGSGGRSAGATLDDDPRTRRSVIPDVRSAARSLRTRRLAPLLLAGFLLSACSSGDGAASRTTPTDEAAAATAGVSSIIEVQPERALELAAEPGTTVIDVRTPDEYDAGHLAGALNVDVNADTFDDRVSELDREVSYVLYCRTGARSAEAAARMAELGFTGIADAGAFEDLVEAGATTQTG